MAMNYCSECGSRLWRLIGTDVLTCRRGHHQPAPDGWVEAPPVCSGEAITRAFRDGGQVTAGDGRDMTPADFPGLRDYWFREYGVG